MTALANNNKVLIVFLKSTVDSQSNQEEALTSLCDLVRRLFDTMDKSELTTEQELLYQEFVLSYSPNDNSDVENVLDIGSFSPNSSNPISPVTSPSSLSRTPREASDLDFSLSSFLKYVSISMITPSFQNESSILSNEAVCEIRTFVSSFADRVVSILQNHVEKKEWMADYLLNQCCECKKPFSASRRRQYAFSLSFMPSHCRWCGRLVCNACSRHRATLSFIGEKQRVCDNCYFMYVNLPTSLHELSALPFSVSSKHAKHKQSLIPPPSPRPPPPRRPCEHRTPR